MYKIIICGANGGMGKVLAEVVKKSGNAVVIAGVDVFTEQNQNSFPIYSKIEDCPEKADIVIDFSRPDALYGNLAYVKATGTPIVIATTGYSPEDKQAIAECAESVPVFFSANMSLGVNLQIDLCKQAASFFADSADIEIIEKHHNLKMDAPSGTALAIADAVNASLGGAMEYQCGRHGLNAKRTAKEIGIHAIRGGRLVGEHQALFITNDEMIEINHVAQSRQVFAVGALRAAEFIMHRPAALYTMQDIIFETRTMTDITASHNEAMITLTDIPHNIGFTAKLFDTIAAHGVNVDIITQSAPKGQKIDLTFTLSGKDVEKAEKTLSEIDSDLHYAVRSPLTKVTVEGVGMEKSRGVAARLFSVLAENSIDIEIITTSETKISFCVQQSDAEKALHSISSALNLKVK